MAEARIILDSISKANVRITTFCLKYPRIVHAELLTHRTFSRNSSSSRALPISKVIEEVEKNPFIPEKFLKNKKGMQATEPIEDQEKAREIWLEGRDVAVRIAKKLQDLKIHKEYTNRILEPYSFIEIVLTATEFTNFFGLRFHKDAQPEIYDLAKKMWIIYSTSTPKYISEGEWHLPFLKEEEKTLPIYKKRIISCARCARVSYKKHDGTNSSFEEDKMLFDKLSGGDVLHGSALEHCAMATGDPNIQSGNFRGWVQFRKTFTNENIKEFSLENKF